MEYAEYLGMNPIYDKDLLWIAKEGLKAPLPAPWKPCENSKQEVYYFNFETRESTWEHPCDQYYRQMFQEEKMKKMIGKSMDKKHFKIPESKQAEKLRLQSEVGFEWKVET